MIAQKHQPHLTNDLINHPEINDQEWAKREGMVAFAGYPLIVENLLVGVMAIFARHQLTDITLEAMASIANSIAVGIDRFGKEEELRKSEERWQLALQGNNDGIWDWDIQTNQAFISARNKQILGYKDDEIANYIHVEQWTSHIHPDDMTWVKETMQDHLAQKTPYYAVEYRLHCQDGSYKWVLSRGQALWDDQGQPVRMVGSITDISDRKLAEEALRQSEAREREKANQLAQTLRELQHTQTQLIHTEKMSSLGQMIAGIAHEINNPVSFIYGNLIHAKNYFQDLIDLMRTYQETYPHPTPAIKQLIEDIELNFILEDWQKVLHSMQIGAERIQGIVRSLQLFCRQWDWEVKPIDIHEGIDNTLLILQHRLRPKSNRPSIQVIKEYSQLPKVTCYASQLNQVFMNLLSNAIDALENQPAPRVITIRTAIENSQLYRQEQIPESVKISIADNGHGISEKVCQQIFDPFFTTKPVGSGTGLGLAISYQIIVEKHGGQLSYVSHPGKGTEFIIEIPIVVKSGNIQEALKCLP